MRSHRADLLGETADGTLIHVELQSTNHPRIALRMLEYALAIHRSFGRFSSQLVLYVGDSPLRMSGNLASATLAYQCKIIDIRELDGEQLLQSSCIGDNITAVLVRLSDEIRTVRRILEKISASQPSLRPQAITELTVLVGLRNLAGVIEKEIERMPILNDIMDHPIIGRERKLGIQMGERSLILSLIAKRFGPVPGWATERIESLAVPELEQLALRVLDAPTLADLFA